MKKLVQAGLVLRRLHNNFEKGNQRMRGSGMGKREGKKRPEEGRRGSSCAAISKYSLLVILSIPLRRCGSRVGKEDRDEAGVAQSSRAV